MRIIGGRLILLLILSGRRSFECWIAGDCAGSRGYDIAECKDPYDEHDFVFQHVVYKRAI